MIVGFQLANSYGENGNKENFSFTIYKERVPKKSWKIPLMKGRGGGESARPNFPLKINTKKTLALNTSFCITIT